MNFPSPNSPSHLYIWWDEIAIGEEFDIKNNDNN